MKLVGKHVLVVGPHASQVTTIAPALEKIGFTMLSAADGRAAVEVASTTPLLSLVAVDDRIGADEGASLIAAVKREHPELPVVWIANTKLSTPLSRGEYSPDAVFETPFDADEVEQDVHRLLLQHLYPPALVRVLSQTATGIMQDAYAATMTSSAHIRANGNALGEINALLPFCGQRVSGRVVVAGQESALHQIRTLALGSGAGGSQPDAGDLAGEIGNLVAGRTKAYFANHGLGFELGTPVILLGSDTVRYRASRPALVLSLDGATIASPLLISFCFDTLATDHLESSAASAQRTPPGHDFGDIVFL